MLKKLFSNTKPLGDILMELNFLKADDLRKAVKVQRIFINKGKKMPLGKVLIKMKLIPKEQLQEIIASDFSIKYIEEIKRIEEIEYIKSGYCLKNNIAPIEADETSVHIATSNPCNFKMIAELSSKINKDIKISLADRRTIRKALKRNGGSKELEIWRGVSEYNSEQYNPIGGVHERENIYFVDSIDKLEQELSSRNSEDSVEALVYWHLLKAIEMGASDIHFEPTENLLRIRHRIDGMLCDFKKNQISAVLAPAVIGRLKVMAKMSLDEKQKPQDGRILLIPKEKAADKYDFRVASSPTINGEEIVMRLLDAKKLEVGYDGLGITGNPQKMIKEAISKPYGLIIITGPTGSGKTTTLYTILKELNKEDRKIITIEDPVEYRIPGIMQHQIREKVDFRFADAVRAFLRHDPDIILVGEIRDKETAEASMWAALTGHLVLTTLHTNDAASTLTRLLQMGIEPYLICSTVSLVISQRLVRKLCPLCRIKKSYTYEYLKRSEFVRNEMDSEKMNIELYAPFTELDNREEKKLICKNCKGKGFSDRIAIVEAMPITERIKEAINNGFTSSEIKKIALEEGMITLREDGFIKAYHGLTSLQEVLCSTL